MAKRRGNNEGSIYQRTNGRWVAQVRIDNKRIAKSFGTQKECRAWIKQKVVQIESGLHWEATKLTVEEYLNQWLIQIEGTVKPKTHSQYAYIVHDYLAPILGKTKLSDLQPYHITQVYNDLKSNGHSQRNIQLVHSVLRRSLVMAVKQGLIGRNPTKAIATPKVIQKEMQVLDDNQVRQLLIAAQGNRYEALYYLAVTTGLRKGELLGLKWEDINWASNTVQVRRQLQRSKGGGWVFSSPKTRAGRRIVQLGSETMGLLAAHRKRQDRERDNPDWQDHDMVFPSKVGTPTGQSNLHKFFKRLLIKAGLPDIRFHDLRHTAATLMLMNGIPLIVVSRRLGHSKPSVTLDIYGHYLPGMQEKAANLMDELVTPIATKWQQIGNSSESLLIESNDETLYGGY